VWKGTFIHDKRDIHLSKETHACEKRSTSVKRDEYPLQKRPVSVKRDQYPWKETYICEKSPISVNMDVYAWQQRPISVKEMDIFKIKKKSTLIFFVSMRETHHSPSLSFLFFSRHEWLFLTTSISLKRRRPMWE